jgi:hypothetical protein
MTKSSGRKFFKFILKTFIFLLFIGCLVFGFLYGSLFVAPEWQEKLLYENVIKTSDSLVNDSIVIKNESVLLNKNIHFIDNQLENLVPNTYYILINTTNNVFCLYKHKKLVRKGLCSTGTYTMLTYNDNKQWIFKTPKGIFHIRGKIANPVWIKPDWAFVEEGLPIPPKNDPSRYESGVLGDYAIAIGEGYYIHGTLYQRFLGLPVTHGCIRLNDEDLEAVYKTLDVGSKVYIF